MKKGKAHGNANVSYSPENELAAATEMVKAHAKEKQNKRIIIIINPLHILDISSDVAT